MKRYTGLDRNITRKWRPATQAIRGGLVRSEFGETSEALFLTSGYSYERAEDAAERFAGEQEGMIYSRMQSPTVMMLEEKLALMEGAETSRTMSTGMAAMTSVLLSALSAGDHFVIGRVAFGSCRWLSDSLLPRFGITATVVDGADVQQWKDAIQPNTKLFFFETPTNPTLELVDIEAVCNVAKEAGILTVVDNAFCTPVIQKPMEFGVDVVAYSATKMMDGQGRVLAGSVAGSNKFVNETLVPFIRNTGPNLSPFNAWVVMKGLETLELRSIRQSENAQILAKFLETRLPRISYPGLKSHPQYALAKKQMKTGGTVLALFLGKDRQQALSLLNNLELIDISNNLGDTRSLMTHPCSTTHSGVAEPERLAMGITEDMLRFSVGLEDVEDLKEDLDQALRKIGL
ncbi:MAG: aminotransferase class I/II-fold pyridoxal phosphate-dependent enzyme [Zymomonas mobilis]|uniref:O-succinylhomoserine sulfhydrylase n=1 Tax=Zymomonas mobilis TaxID=542 RepID=A0A542W0M1_ZYMMB|nr:aminotransferase class I/II-fold pyridoxal phosphate-dependent enzyme [Zymomonas mobilis]TQL17135.1 O-succinylhomoserine sulfhydrylase [Zymomonas mobilis]